MANENQPLKRANWVGPDFLKQVREDHKKLRDIPIPHKAVNPTYGGDAEQESGIFVKITGKYDLAALGGNYPEEASYSASEVITDSNGEFIDAPDAYVWGTSDSTSFPPIVDLSSLGPYIATDLKYKRLPDDTIIKAFTLGNIEGETYWYCDPPSQVTPISFGAVYIFEGGVDKIRINSGNVYGRGFSTNVAETSFTISTNLYVYVTYDITLATYEVSGTTITSQTGRPTEIVDSSGTRTVNIPLCSFDADKKITRYWEGDISVNDIYGHWYDGTNSPLDLTYSDEHSEEAISDTGWDRDSQGANSGVIVTIQTGESYYDDSDKILYSYVRDFTYDQEGKLVLISEERRLTTDVTEPCV